MTKKTKAIRTIAAVTAAALLGGGIYLLVKKRRGSENQLAGYSDLCSYPDSERNA